jgi:hypothetical protein
MLMKSVNNPWRRYRYRTRVKSVSMFPYESIAALFIFNGMSSAYTRMAIASTAKNPVSVI